jgi:hypothetical protein
MAGLNNNTASKKTSEEKDKKIKNISKDILG